MYESVYSTNLSTVTLEVLNQIKQYQICGLCETSSACEEQFDKFVDKYTSFMIIRKNYAKRVDFRRALPFSYEMT